MILIPFCDRTHARSSRNRQPVFQFGKLEQFRVKLRRKQTPKLSHFVWCYLKKEILDKSLAVHLPTEGQGLSCSICPHRARHIKNLFYFFALINFRPADFCFGASNHFQSSNVTNAHFCPTHFCSPDFFVFGSCVRGGQSCRLDIEREKHNRQ